MSTSNNKLDGLLQVIDTLTGPNGCPWDQKQTPETMGKYIVEEAYEAFYEIEKQNTAGVREELGDVLFLVCFITKLYAQKGAFTLDDVIDDARAKMVRRHPHIFADSCADTPEKVIDQWVEIKKQEKAAANGNTIDESILDSIPSNMAPLKRAFKVSARAARARFDWPNMQAVIDKLDEEVAELKAALAEKDETHAKEEIGDVFFTLANVARFMGDDPERLTNLAVTKFEKRFRALEKIIAKRGEILKDVPEDEKGKIWDAIKMENAKLKMGNE